MTCNIDIEAIDGLIRLALLIDDEVVWPHPDHADGTADFDPEDVASYLADAWGALLLQQFWPIDFAPNQQPQSVTGLLRAAEDRWESMADEEAAIECSLIDTFIYEHDLAQMKHGANLRSCFILREHDSIRIETGSQVYKVLLGQLADALIRIGSLAVELLKQRGSVTADRVVERWEQRDRHDPVMTASLISGLPYNDLKDSADLSRTLVQTVSGRSLLQIANDNRNPICAAARSSGILGPATLADILSRLVSIERGNIAALRELRRQIQPHLKDTADATDQGARAATFIRDWLRQPPNTRVDLKELSRRLGIRVQEVEMTDDHLDGLAVLGPEHGPAILLNRNTRRQGKSVEDLERSLRFTCAHEIGHLLLDQDEWPALVDAARQRVPELIERRANAFSTYLLLQPSEAFAHWEDAGSPYDWIDLEALLNVLTTRFGLPRINASRQVARGAPIERRTRLDQVFRSHIPRY